MTGRPRTSTLVLAATFVITLVAYLWVRPEPRPPTELVPAVRVPVSTEAPRTTTTRRPRETTTTTTDEPAPSTSVPVISSTTTPSPSTTTMATLFPTTTSTTRR